MAFIDYISYEDASPELQAVYDKYGGPEKIPANIVRVASIRPKIMDAHVGLYRAIATAKGPLTRAQREMVAVLVSGINSCHY